MRIFFSSFSFIRKACAHAAAAAFVLCTIQTPVRAQDAGLIEAAKKEGQLTWYTGIIISQLVRPLSEAFEKKYGVKVNYVSMLEPETVLRLQNEARAGHLIGDLFDSSGAIFPPLKAADLVAQYAPKSADVFPAALKDKDGYFTSIYSLYLTTGYNTDLVKENEAPKTYEDLLDPKWKGKMVWADIRAMSGPAGFIANVLRDMGEEKGMAYLKKLAQQKITGIAANQRVVLDQVIAGQYSIGLMIYNHHTLISRAQGAPVKAARTEPFVGHLGAIFPVKGSPHPNAAKLFLEFMSSEEGQTIVRDANYPPSNPNIAPKDPAISPKTAGFKFMMLTPYDTGEPLAKWLKIYDELFKS